MHRKINLSLLVIQRLSVFLFTLNILAYFCIKVLAGSLIIGTDSGNDSDYYNDYALGNSNNRVNAWASLLRQLHISGIYERVSVSIVLYILYLLLAFLIPLLAAPDKWHVYKEVRAVKKFRWIFSCWFLAYPTFFFLTLDIYRDVFMIGIFCLTLLLVKCYFNEFRLSNRIIYLTFICVLSVYLVELRLYLGAAAFVALFLSWHPRKYRLYILVFLACSSLVIIKSLGLIDPILIYRGEDGFIQGGSSLGIGLIGENGLVFLVSVIKSTFFQLFGFYFHDWKAGLVFIVESLPFLISFWYVLANRVHMDRFCLYLFYFSIIYACFWILGNDNLGTAVRLRVFNYITMPLIAFRIYSIKSALEPARGLWLK
jgi:hypothetical protein